MASRVLALSVNYNGGHWIVAAVKSLLEQTYVPDIVVVDNASTDGSAAELRRLFPQVQVIETGKNLGSVAGYNYALRYPEYEFLFLLNPDANAPPQAVETLLSIMQAHPSLAVLGPAIVEEHDPQTVQAFAPRNDFFGFPFDPYEGMPVSALPKDDLVPSGYPCAAAAMYRLDVFRALHGMDEKFFMFTEEPDYSWRARLRGYESAVTPRVRVRHVGGASAAVGTVGGVYTTSVRRIYLRERNSLVMSMKCFAGFSLAFYLPLQLLALAGEAAVLWATRHGDVAAAYFEAIRDAFKMLPQILADRSEIQTTRTLDEARILRSFTPGYAKLRMLLKRGMPNFVSWKRS